MLFDRLGSTLLFAVAANTDNLTVGIAYGLKQRRIRWGQNLLIAVMTTVITLVALAAGRTIRGILPPRLPDILGGALLISLAVWSVYRDQRGAVRRLAQSNPGFADQTAVGLGESLTLAGSLSINNIGLAIASGIGGVSYVSTAVAICCLSITMLTLGQSIGTSLIRVKAVSQVLRYSLSGNAALALAGALMLAGF